MKVFVILPLLYQEWQEFRQSILFSFNNIYSTFNTDCFFYLVFQDKKINELAPSDTALLNDFPNYEVFFTDELNVSNARNIGIRKAMELAFSHLLFHDSSVVFSQNACLYFKNTCNANFIPKLSVSFQSTPFSNNQESISNFASTVKPKRINPIRDCYLWSYIFKVCFINDLFDINLGPGEDTFYKCGEDVLFLFSYLDSSKINISKTSPLGVVFHPSRSNDFSKHLLYARGQGHLFKILLHKNLKNRKRIFYEFFLFMGNAIFRIILFRKNSMQIFKLRLKGFLD